MNAALDVRDVSYRIGGLHLTDSVSLQVRTGERHALMGPNGAGKTTLMNLIAGVLAPSSGQILLDGRDVTRRRAHQMARAGVARTFQVTNLLASHTVAENLAFAVASDLGCRRSLCRRWWRLSEVWDRVDELVVRAGLVDVANRPVSALAYGVQRQLEIAVAVARPASVILLDEPGAGLSSDEAEVLIEMVFALGDQIAVLFIDHDVDLVLRLATHVTVLDVGRVVADGTPDEIRRSDVFNDIYLGSARA